MMMIMTMTTKTQMMVSNQPSAATLLTRTIPTEAAVQARIAICQNTESPILPHGYATVLRPTQFHHDVCDSPQGMADYIDD
jgi:hypothetical protein